MEWPTIAELLNTSGITALAILAVTALTKVWKARLDDANQRAAEIEQRVTEERNDKLLLIKTLEGNTQALTKLSVLIERANNK